MRNSNTTANTNKAREQNAALRDHVSNIKRQDFQRRNEGATLFKTRFLGYDYTKKDGYYYTRSRW